MTSTDKLKAYLRTSRWEYIIAEVPALFTLFFLASPSPYRLLAPEVLEGLVVFVLLYFFGFMVNAYADRDIDGRYTLFKNKLPGAVALIGLRRFRLLMAAQVAAAFVLTAHISYLMGSWVPLALVAIGTFFGAGYSLPPLQFKVRGWLHPVSLSISVFFVPGAFVYYAIAGQLTAPVLFFLTGFSVLHYGIEFANQAIDYMEDREAGVRSPPVRWGLERSLVMALGAIAAGMGLELAALYYIIVQTAGAGGIFGLAAPAFFLLGVPIILAGYYLPVSGLWRMYRAVAGRPVGEAIDYMKRICHYNRWQASGITGLMVVTCLLFVGRLFS